MTIDRKPSGTAKAGLTTGIIGTSLGALNLMGNAGGLLGGLANNGCGAHMGACGCSEDHLVDRYTLGQAQEIESLKSQIALRDANTFTDQKFIELYKYFDGELRTIRDTMAGQAVKNQQTADSFQLITERMQCCCNSLEEKIKAEKAARQCADNSIVNYVNATFYPKMVADVTTGSTTTAQTLYNPLPIQIDGNGNCNFGC